MAKKGNLLSQNDINNLRTAITIEVQKNTLQDLKTKLDGICTDEANQLKEEIDAALQKLRGDQEHGIKPILLLQSEIDKLAQATQNAMNR